MFASSLVVIPGGLLMGALALAAFAWALRRGQFDALDARAVVILDERDLRTHRPWETPLQTAARAAEHGPLLEAARGRPGWCGVSATPVVAASPDPATTAVAQLPAREDLGV